MRTALIYNFLIEANLMASTAILVMMLVRAVGRRKIGNSAICLAWLLVAARLLIPLALPNPFIHEIRSAFSQDTAIRPIAGQIQVRFGDAVNRLCDQTQRTGGPLEEALRSLRDDAGNGMLSIRLMKVYIAGVTAVFCWFGISSHLLHMRLRAGSFEPISGNVLEKYEELCREIKVKPVPVWFADSLPGARLVGCFKPYIALPVSVKANEMEQVFRHELYRLKNREHWWEMVRHACCAVHWFNPLVWLAARMSRTDADLVCEERAGHIAASMQANRGIAICFLTAASVALAAAFATAETPLVGRIPQGGMDFRASAITESTIEMTEEEKSAAVEQAKAFWQNDALKADVNDHLEWHVQAYLNHVEVHAFDPDWGETLILAFAPDGRVLYMNNRRSGDRDAVLTEERTAMLSEDKLNQLKEYALSVLEDMEPGLTDKMGELVPSSHPTKYNGLYFYRFYSYQPDNVAYVFNVQTYPEVRLTYYENLLELDDDASNRLEPGNG